MEESKKDRAAKCSVIEEQKRVQHVIEQLISGEPTLSILNKLSEETGLQISACRPYLTKAYKTIRELTETNIEEFRTKAISELAQDAKNALANGETRLAFDIKKEINKISGGYNNEQKIEVSGSLIQKVIIEIVNNKDENEDA